MDKMITNGCEFFEYKQPSNKYSMKMINSFHITIVRIIKWIINILNEEKKTIHFHFFYYIPWFLNSFDVVLPK